MDTLQDTQPAPVRPQSSGGSPQWRWFLRALIDEIDTFAEGESRDAMLRGVGTRMAQMLPVPQASSIETLEMEMNDLLGAMGWGSVKLELNEAERCLMLKHYGLPRIGAAGDPPGSWLAPILEGLYEGWMSQQPGADDSLSAMIQPGGDPGVITLRYARA
ncbi:MAG: cellulose synthase [Acidisphaera sp.]|nr:cellulose synthase [Acidisphaera sp.]